MRRQWSTVMDKVRERSRTLGAMLTDAVVSVIDGDTLVLSHQSGNLAKRLGEQRNTDVIREALKDALGVDWKVRCELAASSDAKPAEDVRRAEEDSMLAEAGDGPSADAPRRDPEEVALELLQTELGARRIDS